MEMAARLLAVLMLFMPFVCVSQTDSTVNKKRLIFSSAAVGVAYTGSMIALGKAWYEDAPTQSFHFFNDAAEWKQMDKAGHFLSAFHLNDHASGILRSCNLPRKKSDLIGAATAMIIISSIEIFDGYSAAYGASATDLAANAAGSAFYLAQSFAWNDVRLHPKLSFHTTALAKQRPDVLGSGVSEIIKNYNGQTFWLSANVKKFIPGSNWPAWLNVAGGYGAENMFYARDSQNKNIGLDPYRQYYLSLDVDLTAIPVKSKFLKTVFKVLNVVKIPAPALEFSRKGVRAHGIYF
jgi:uncharacterized protein YfiM (DUF2279 family)